MSDKKFQIEIVATGGDAAAAEIKKPTAAAVVSISQLEKELLEARAAFKAAAVGSDEFTAAQKRLEAANLALNTAHGKVTTSGLTMKGSMQNVGYQVQDLAVQLGSGTSAFVAFGQQAPQLLSGFGPVGVMLGTLAAVALPLAGAMFKLGDATKEAGEKAEDSEDKWKRLNDARTAKTVAAALALNKLYLDSLDDEFEKLDRNNQAVQRTIDLLQAKHRNKVAEEDVQAALELAEIDASDKPEAEKIRARAKVSERMELKKLENAKTESGFVVNAAENKASGADNAFQAGRTSLQGAGLRLADQQAEMAELKGRAMTADSAQKLLPKVDEEITKGQKLLEMSLDKQITDSTRSKLVKDQARKAELEADSNNITSAERTRLEALQGKKNDKGEIDTSTGEIAQTQKEINDLSTAIVGLASAAEQARLDAEKIKTQEGDNISSQERRTSGRLRINEVTSNFSATAVEKREKGELDRKNAEAQLEARKEDLASLASANRERVQKSTTNTSNIGQSDKTKEKELIMGLGDDIGNADTAREIETVRKKIETSQSELGTAVVGAMKAMLDKQLGIQRQIEILQGQIKNNSRK